MAISDFQFVVFLASKSLKIIFFEKNVYKIYPFSNFQKPDDMLCRLISTIHIPKMKTIHLFLIPKWSKKPTKIIGNFLKCLFWVL